MQRREFITLIGGAAAWPLAVRAQPERMRRVGVLMGLAEDDPETKARLTGFRQGLEKRGWSEGHNVRIDYRFAPAGAQAQVLAKELVALQPDAIFANGTPNVAALQRESSTIPIVFAGLSDPIGSGFIASLFADGSCWAKVIPLLTKRGLKAIAVQNPLSSLADDVTAAHRVIGMQEGPVLLVGHSWGGAVITEAGNHAQVKGLVYVAAGAPDSGQSFAD